MILPLGRTVAVLKALPDGQGRTVATRTLNAVWGRTTVRHETQRTREFLHRLRAAGLVEGLPGRDGGIRQWAITEAGRQFLRDHKSTETVS